MHKTPLAVTATIALAFTLAGCGATKSSTDPSTTGNPSGPQGPGAGQFSKIQDCLKAAGLAQNLPSGPPSGIPSNLPSGRPSGAPTGFPSGGPRGLTQLNNPQIQDALKACGITLPQPGAGAPPS